MPRDSLMFRSKDQRYANIGNLTLHIFLDKDMVFSLFDGTCHACRAKTKTKNLKRPTTQG